MLMDTFKTVNDALSKELWEFLDHFEDMKLINSDMANSLWYHKDEGMKYLNPEPEIFSFSSTLYYCNICGGALSNEPMTDGYTYTCEQCNKRSRT